MTDNDKLDAMHRHLGALGVERSTAFPPAWRLLWRAGWHVAPPLFIGFWRLAAGTGAAFGLLWGLAMRLLSAFFPVTVTVGSAALAGVSFGLLFAALVRMKARRYNLPPWSEYTGDGTRA